MIKKMKPFVKAIIPQDEIELVVKDMITRDSNLAVWDARKQVEKEFEGAEVWLNDKYQVLCRKIQTSFGWVWWLSIKRLDKECIHDWRELQEIKNQLVGLENEGLELYPAESRLMDTANQYHLWVFADPAQRIPLGWNQRVVTEDPIGKSKQRSFEEPK